MEERIEDTLAAPSTVPPSDVPLVPTPQKPTRSKMTIWLVSLACIVMVFIGAGVWFFAKVNKSDQPDTAIKTATDTGITLTWAVHWAELVQQKGIYVDGKLKTKGVQQYLDEYHALNPNVKVKLQVIPYNDYANKLKVLSDADAPPDIYQTYSTWAVSYVREGVLDTPPEDIQEDVAKNYISPAGATINGKIWGIPTETNNYNLLYNKDIFKAAGIIDTKGEPVYPRTWKELVTTAIKLTKKDNKGNISQYGIAFLKGNDWQVVDPFVSLLISNGGQYLSPDFTSAQFNSPAGVAALEAQLELFTKGATDINGNFFDFGDKKVAMVISPPWTKTQFKQKFGDSFATSVGVAPLPILMKPASVQYSWFMGVMAKSPHKKEAWDFLRWLSSDIQPSGTTRYGDLMAENIGGIPARTVDFTSHTDILGDSFTKMYVDQMKHSIPEPNVLQANMIKASLMKQIEAAWSGQKTAKAALDAAATEVNGILSQYY